MKKPTEILKSDIRILQQLAKEVALAQVYCASTRVEYFAMLSDGRRCKSKKLLALKAKREAAKEKMYKGHNKARDIYKSWKYVGVCCVAAGQWFQDIMMAFFDRFMAISKEIGGDEELKNVLTFTRIA